MDMVERSGFVDRITHSLTLKAAGALLTGLSLAACTSGDVPGPNGTPSVSAEAKPGGVEASSSAEQSPMSVLGIPKPGDSEAHGRAGSPDWSPHNWTLQALGELESEHKLADGVMSFYGLPGTNGDIGSDVTNLHVDKMTQLFTAGFRNTLSVIEPAGSVSEMTSPQNQKMYANYLAYLQKSGISADHIGTAVVMPELLWGGWKGADVPQYAKIVESQAKVWRDAFGGALPVATLVDVAEVRQEPEFLNQLKTLRPDTLSSIVVQGFSNGRKVPMEKTASGLRADVESYLDPEVIQQISVAAGAKKPVIINTGIGEAKYGAAERAAIADGIVRVVKALRAKGVPVAMVMAFLEDKSATQEGINFSFPEPAGEDPDNSQKTLLALKKELATQRVAMGLFGSKQPKS